MPGRVAAHFAGGAEGRGERQARAVAGEQPAGERYDERWPQRYQREPEAACDEARSSARPASCPAAARAAIPRVSVPAPRRRQTRRRQQPGTADQPARSRYSTIQFAATTASPNEALWMAPSRSSSRSRASSRRPVRFTGCRRRPSNAGARASTAPGDRRTWPRVANGARHPSAGLEQRHDEQRGGRPEDAGGPVEPLGHRAAERLADVCGPGDDRDAHSGADQEPAGERQRRPKARRARSRLPVVMTAAPRARSGARPGDRSCGLPAPAPTCAPGTARPSAARPPPATRRTPRRASPQSRPCWSRSSPSASINRTLPRSRRGAGAVARAAARRQSLAGAGSGGCTRRRTRTPRPARA